MKNRDEYIDSIFEKRDKYVAEQRRKRRTVLSVCIPLTVCIAAAVIVVNSPIKSFSKTGAAMDNACMDSTLGFSSEAETAEVCSDELLEVAMGAFPDYAAEESVTYNANTVATAAPSITVAEKEEAAKESHTEAIAETSVITATSAATTTVKTEFAATQSVITTKSAIITATTTVTTGSSTQSTVNPTLTGATISSNNGYSTVCNIDSDISLSDVNNALAWTYHNDFNTFEDASEPEGEIFAFYLSFSDGSTAKILWKDNYICKNGGNWKTVPDSFNNSIDTLFN